MKGKVFNGTYHDPAEHMQADMQEAIIIVLLDGLPVGPRFDESSHSRERLYILREGWLRSRGKEVKLAEASVKIEYCLRHHAH